MKIFSGSSNKPLAKEICKFLDEPFGNVYLHSFPSGERYCQYKENIRGHDVFIIQSLGNPVNDNLMELLVMIDAARRASARRITAVIPYMGYLRQDRKTKSRTPISGRLIADMIESTGVDRLIGMDFHCAQAQGFFKIPVDHLYATPVIAEYVNGGIDVVVSPDVGGVKRAHAYAETMKAGFAFIAKKRVSDTEVELSEISGDVKGKNILIVDDMTESAGTLISAAGVCKDAGANKVTCAVTHGLFTDVANGRFNYVDTPKLIDEFIYTNTTQGKSIQTEVKMTQLSVASLLGRAIKRTNTNESISELFKVEGF